MSSVRAEAMKMAAQPDTPPSVVVEKKVEVEKPTVPTSLDQQVKSKTTLWGWITGIFGSGGVGLAGLLGTD